MDEASLMSWRSVPAAHLVAREAVDGALKVGIVAEVAELRRPPGPADAPDAAVRLHRTLQRGHRHVGAAAHRLDAGEAVEGLARIRIAHGPVAEARQLQFLGRLAGLAGDAQQQRP